MFEYKIINGKSEEVIPSIEDNSIDLVVTSPPYNVDLGNNKYNKNPYNLYNDNKDHQDYINWLESIFKSIYPKLKTGGRVAINVGDGKNGGIPTHSDIIQFMTRNLHYIPMTIILWDKHQTSNRCAWGSFQSPSSPSFPRSFEYVMIFAKETIKLQGTGETDLTKEEFTKWSLGSWTISPEKNMKSIGHPACVDVETECLTSTGWKKYNELSIGETIASFNMNTYCTEWDTLRDIISYTNNEPVIHVDGRSLNMVLSKNHRCIVKKNFKCKSKPFYRIIEANNLKSKDEILCSSFWNTIDSKNQIDVDINIASLLGWFISEGHYVRDRKNRKIYTIHITQSYTANSNNILKIEKLLKKIKAEYNTNSRTRTRVYKNKEKKCGLIDFSIKGGIRDIILEMTNSLKQIPDDILLWKEDALRSFFEAMIDGDGHRRKNGFEFIQKDPKILNIMQCIGVRLGYDSYLSCPPKKAGTVYFTTKKHKLLRNSKKTIINTLPHKGILWCPVVKNNKTFVARRAGHVFITGNCFPVELPYRLIKMLSWKSGTVLDPFSGSGTTGVVCKITGRKYIGIELSEDYCKLSEERINSAETDIFDCM